MDLTGEINNLALQHDITYFGVACLQAAREAVLAQGGEEMAGFPFAISLGIPLNKHIVDQLPNREQPSAAVNYRHHAYDIINMRLDLSASLLSDFIQAKGYRVLPLPASKRVDDERICAAFSHKLGAHVAGLGWIGKSCLLVTPEHGPRVRWTSVLTDAPLVPTGKSMEQRCGRCTACVDICPVQAFTGRTFDEQEPREARYDARLCERYFEQMEKEGKLPVCGLCLYVCPHGRRD